MTRINDRLLVQRADDYIVVLDESAGAEIAFPVEEATQVAHAMWHLIHGQGEGMDKITLLSILDDMRARVESGDSMEGSIEYLIPWSPNEPDQEPGEGVDFNVRAAYRIGNLQGQGGMRMIGKT